MQKWCGVLLIFVLFGSCLDNDICLRGADNALVINFKKLSDGLEDTVTLLNIESAGTNAVYYLEDPDTVNSIPSTNFSSDVLVLVNPYADSTHFTFNNFRGDTLTLTVGYKTEVRFVSEECGSERLQYDLSIIKTTFDSVRVVRRSLDKGRSTNIEIYH
jgi:Family of unknown function (DUF6452)